MICIPGYDLLETVFTGQKVKLCRALSLSDGKKVLLKIDQYGDKGMAAARCSYELAVAGNLYLPAICRPLKLEYCGDTPVLVMEDRGGLLLKQYMCGRSLSIEQFLSIARRLAAATGALHRHNIAHKNVNPANIFIDPLTHEVFYTGFCAAAPVCGEGAAPNPPPADNDPAYMSPEQTGLLDREADYRTDFYSLGVIFFQLLTGRLPFPETDFSRLIHAHLAKKPPSLQRLRPSVPPPLADVVQKLLAKNAAERYQSARALMADLNRCRREWRRAGQIRRFPLGRHDIPAIMQLPLKLYGREKELELLQRSYQAVKREGTGFVFVSGFAGSGKTTLVNQFLSSLAGRGGGYCIAGKCDQFQRDRPYVSFVQALRGLLHQVLSADKETLNRLREQLLRNLGAGGAVLFRILPEIELLTGPLPAVESLPPEEERNRFLLAVRNFLRTFTAKESPLVIFLDDLQWADNASLELIRFLALSPKDCLLLFIGAYRDSEVGSGHPLAAVVDMLRPSGVLWREIRLPELDWEQTAMLVNDMLRGGMRRIKPLAQALHQKTGGNPFFLHQLLQSLGHNRALFFNLNRWRWEWDLESVHKLPYHEEVLDFLEDKLKRLDPETLDVLKEAACCGHSFSTDYLAAVGKRPLERVQECLRRARSENLVLQDEEGCCRFAHDRIRQAVYRIIPTGDKKILHLRLGRMLVERSPGRGLKNKIMEIVYHLNLGAELIASRKERLRLAEYNLLAGRVAKSSAAYESARRYLLAGLALLSEYSPGEHRALRQVFFKEIAPCEYMCGNYTGAQEILDTALLRARTPLEKADLYMLKNICHTGLGQYEAAVKEGLAGLRELGINIPLKPHFLSFLGNYFRIGCLVHKRAFRNSFISPEQADPRPLKEMELLISLFAPSYHLPTLLFPSLILKLVELSLKYPNLKYAPIAVGSYAQVAAFMFGTGNTVYRWGKDTLDLLKTSSYPSVRGRYIYAFTFFINHWVAHKKTSLGFLEQVFDDALASGDSFYAGHALSGLVEFKYYCGFPLREIVEDCRRHLDWLRTYKMAEATNFLSAFKHLAESLLEEGDGRDFGAAVSREAGTVPFGTSRSYYILAIQWFYLMGRYREGLHLAGVIARNIESIAREPAYPEYCFYYALCISASWPGMTVRERRCYRKLFKKYRSCFRKWARLGPENFEHRRLLLEAEAARLRGRTVRTMQFYEEAIRAAGENGYPQEQALANLLAAEYYQGRNMDGIAAFFLEKACRGFAGWGARAVVRRVQKQYTGHEAAVSRNNLEQAPESWAIKENEAGRKSPPPRSAVDFTAAERDYAGSLDLASLIKASRTLVEEGGWHELARRLMRILCENAGAQCGALIRLHGGEPYIDLAVKAAAGEFASLPRDFLVHQRYIPRAIVQLVWRTGETLLLEDACSEGPFMHDPDVAGNKIHSLCCFSLPSRNNSPAIFYLGNNLISGVFTEERFKIARLLAVQTAFVAGLSEAANEPAGRQGLFHESRLPLPESLTPREMEVLNLLASGLANREIAARLGLSLSTVKSHIQNIYGKLGVNRRLRAVARARKMDLLQ